MGDTEQGRGRAEAEAEAGSEARAKAAPRKSCSQPAAPKSLRSCMPQITACMAAGLFNFPEGLTLSYSSSLLPELQRADSEVPITLDQGVLLASSMVACMAVGTLLAGVIMNRFGRLNTIRFCMLPFAAGWFLVASARSFEQILLGRILTGLANPLGVNGAVVYCTEVAPSHLRGALNGAHPTMASLGIVAGYVLGAVTDWRTTAWISGASPALVLVLMHFCCPESPIWLVSKGRLEEAAQSLRVFARCGSTQDSRERLPERMLEWLVQRRACGEARPAQTVPWYHAILDLFRQPVGYKPLLILTAVFVAQSFSGVYITLFYAAPFFQEMGVSVDPLQAAIYVGVVRFFSGSVAVALIGNVGIRKLVVSSSLGMAVCMALSGYFTLQPEHGLGGWVAVGLMLVYVAASCCGLLTVPWTMTAELYPDHLRDVGQSCTVFIADMIMFAALQLYPTLMSTFQYGDISGAVGIQWFFAAVALANVFLVVLFLPETHGKSLEEVEKHFQTNTLWLGRTKPKVVEDTPSAGRPSVVYVVDIPSPATLGLREDAVRTLADARKASDDSGLEESIGESYRL